MPIEANYHTHSKLCDGSSTLRECVEEAIKIHFKHLGFSGHMDADVHMDFEKYLREVNQLKKEYYDKIEILCGVELDNLYDPRYAEKVDYVIGSTHFLDVDYIRPLSIDDTHDDFVLLLNTFYNGDCLRMCREYYELEAAICDKFPCTFIGHFDLITKFNNELHYIDEDDPKYLTYAFDAMEVIARKGIPFEINTRQAHRGKLFPGKRLLERLKLLGGEIIISSDAHNCLELNKGFDYAIQVAKECGFDHTCCITKKNGKIEYVQVEI